MTTRIGLARLVAAVCLASTVLGCGATEVGEENVALGQSSEAIIGAAGGVLDASGFEPAVGQLYVYPGDYCTGTLIDDHTVLTAGHCVCQENDPTCMYGGIFENADPRSEFHIIRTNDGQTTLYKIPVAKWALKTNVAGRDDLALVRLAFRVPGSMATPVPLATVPWGENVADYGTFGAGPGPDEAPNAKRVGLHSGTFTYADNQNIKAGSGDSGGPTIARWTPPGGSAGMQIIAVNSAVNQIGLTSADPITHAAWIQGTRLGWDILGLPPVKSLPQDVTWTNILAATVDDDKLVRAPGWEWTAGASSVEVIPAGNGYAQFSTAETNKHKMAGLSHGDNDQGYWEIDYAIYLANNGSVQVYESGGYRGSFGSYAAGDVFRVEVAGGQVRYRQNGRVFHSSSTAPTYPLVLDTSLHSDGATITNASVETCAAGDTGCVPAEFWKNVGSATSNWGSLTRRPGWEWAAGGSSVEEISAGDGYAEFSTAETNKHKMAGLSHGDDDRGYWEIDYAIYLNNGGLVQIYERGEKRGDFGSYAAGDVFRVEVAGGQVRYRQNGRVFHSSMTPPTYPLVLDTSLHSDGATITNSSVETCVAGDTNCMPVEFWKNVGMATAAEHWVTGHSLTRRPGWEWAAGGSSVEEISAGDGYAEFSTAETNKHKMAGLSHGDDDRGYWEIDYAIYLNDGGLVQIYERGEKRGDFGSYAAGDVFRVEVAGGQVRYRQNGRVFHSSSTAPTYPLVLDTSLHSDGATITNASVNGGTEGCGDVTFEGQCNGDVLVWCEQGVLTSHDCATDGRVCGYQNATVGYNCLTPPGSGGFGYPVGDKTTSPAGGWTMIQVMGHYLNSPDGFHGGHLAQDIGTTEAATANAPVYSVADGEVLYAGSNSSTYVNVVLIKHDLGNGQKICSFYGHLGTTTVTAGQTVHRGDQIATILDWNAYFGKPMSHLHYVFLNEALCDASDAANGALICGYDNTQGPSGITDLSNEPAVYTSVGDVCGDQNYPNAFYSPSQFIDAHHF